MLQETKNCEICGKVFQPNVFSSVCTDCADRDEKEFQKVREYIYLHGRANIFDVITNLEVSISKIKRYLREGRLEIVEKVNSFLKCEACGRPIQSGRYCDDCYKQVYHDFKGIYSGSASDNTVTRLNFTPSIEKAKTW